VPARRLFVRRLRGAPYRSPDTEVRLVIDIAYLLGTAGFFALMLAYVAGCARLGRGAASGGAASDR
jgi:hypothetical protein